MATLTVTEIWDGRSGRITRDGIRTYTRTFFVRQDTFTDDAAQVRVAVDPGTLLPIPALGDSFGLNDADAVVIGINPAQNPADPRVWTVSVEYSSDPAGDSGVPFESENPLTRAPVESFSFSRYTEAMEQDSRGNDLINSAKDRFVPSIERDRSSPVLSIQRNEVGFVYTTATAFVDTVNDAPFRGVAIGGARMLDISAVTRFHQTAGTYFDVTYQIGFRQADPAATEGWSRLVMDRGFRELIAGVHVPMVDQNRDSGGRLLSEEAPSEPPNLNGAGLRNPVIAAPVYIEFFPYAQSNWAPLGL